MASETRTVDLKYRADIAQLKSELAKVPGVTDREAKKMVSALDKQLKRAEKAAKRTGANTKTTFKGLEDGAGEADSVLQGLASGLDLIDPKLGAVARTAGDAAGGFEAIARSAPIGVSALGALGVAAAALGGTYLYLKGELEAATAKQDKAAESARKMAEAYKTLKTGVQSLQDEIGLMTGEIDEFDIALREKLAGVGDAYKPMIARQGELVKGITAERDALVKAITAQKLHGESLESAQGRLQSLNRVLSKQAGVLSTLKGDYSDTLARVDLLVDHKRALAEATENEADAEKAVTTSLREQAAARDQLLAITQKATDAQMSAEERIATELARQLALINELGVAADDRAAAAEAAAAAISASERKIADEAEGRAEAERGNLAAVSVLRDQELRDLEKIAQAQRAAASAAVGYFGEISGGIESIFGELAAFEGMDEDTSKAFAVLQELAGLLGNAAGAIGGFMSGNIGAGLMGIGGGIGNISGLFSLGRQGDEDDQAARPMPVYHNGATFGRSSSGDPSEMDARLLRSEVGGILTRQGQAAIGGPSAVQAANAGAPGASNVALFQLDHRVVQTALERSAQRGGSLRRLLVGSNPRLGHFDGGT